MKDVKGVVQRDGGYWFNRQVRGKRAWVNLQTRDFAEAVKRAIDVKDHPLVASGGSDFERFLADQKERGRYTAQSSETRRYALQAYQRHLGKKSPVKASVNECQAFYDALRERLSESTAISYINTVRAFFNWAIQERFVAINPCKAVKLARYTPKARECFCDRELKARLIQKADRDDLRFVLFCGFDAGLRRGEIVEARRDWFDLDAKILHVRKTSTFMPKDRDERSIPMTEPFVKFMAKFCKALKSDSFVLHPEVRHGKFRYRYDFRRPFTEYMVKQGCPWVTPHIMRHSFASVLASAGVSIFKIATWLGDDVRVVQRHYAKLVSGDLDIHALTSGKSPARKRSKQRSISATANNTHE